VTHPAIKSDQTDPLNDRQDGTVRLWLSQRQWMSILEGTERQARDAQPDPRSFVENKRKAPRLPAPEDAGCLIRMGNNTDEHGTYLVKLRDVSTTGLGFHSAHPFAPKTRCTIALQDAQGYGLVCAARIVWCKPLDNDMHNVGIQFDKPIDAERFSCDNPETPC